MTDYIIKSILCSGILLLCYHLFLQKEKMFRFNRFYLLFSIVFSLTIPLVTIEIPEHSTPVEIARYIPTVNQDPVVVDTNQLIPKSENYDWFQNSHIYIYCLVTSLLLLRLGKNLRTVLLNKKNKEIIRFEKYKLVLLTENVVTFTFLNYIFVSKEAYQNNLIEKEILVHELAHVKQKHSLDILFTEVVQALCWFNPLMFFYKKPIQLNHEFLADDAVLNTKANVKSYQVLLLDKILYTRQVELTSSFNFSITKKRLAMMTAKNSKAAIFIKKLILVPSIFLIAFIFAFRAKSQQTTAEPVKSVNKPVKSDGVSQKHFDEYQRTIKDAVTTTVNKNVTRIHLDRSKIDIKRMDVIYRSMNDAQRAVATKVYFIPMGLPPEKSSPSQEQLDSWLNEKKYGVWLDEKRIKNEELKRYKPSDFDYYGVSKLEKNAYNYGKHYFQVGVLTKKAFKKWHDEEVPLDAIPE